MSASTTAIPPPPNLIATITTTDHHHPPFVVRKQDGVAITSIPPGYAISTSNLTSSAWKNMPSHSLRVCEKIGVKHQHQQQW